MKITTQTTNHGAEKTGDIYSPGVSAHLRETEPGLTTAVVFVKQLEYFTTIFSTIAEITLACVLKNGCQDEDGALMDILGFSETAK